MDYLEGALLHSWWSDTDYETRKHTGTWLLLSLFTFFALAYAVYKLNVDGRLPFPGSGGRWAAVTIVFFLLSPLLCMIYYKLPFVLRLAVLAGLMLKYLALAFWALGAVAGLLILPENFSINQILVWGNDTFGAFLERSTNTMGVSGLFVGGALLAAIGIAAGVLILGMIIFAPILGLKLFNASQYLWDHCFIWLKKKITELITTYNKTNSPQISASLPVKKNEKKVNDSPGK